MALQLGDNFIDYSSLSGQKRKGALQERKIYFKRKVNFIANFVPSLYP